MLHLPFGKTSTHKTNKLYNFYEQLSIAVVATDPTILLSRQAPDKVAMPIANTKSLLEQISDSINFEVDPLMGLHFKNDIMTVDVLKSQKLALVP